eukprot:CAMPEP_0117540760 /NCGR_PEP_ID=MMETSP0784-20121206/43665_1 /TAXON_ID=39447 /ORGANISM="" /LENGTH=42 /DNA_ID= /DNA_START= /DNA_END= /DNA_ORIENTATION=
MAAHRSGTLWFFAALALVCVAAAILMGQCTIESCLLSFGFSP